MSSSTETTAGQPLRGRRSCVPTALVVVHLSSLDAYAWHASEYGQTDRAPRLGSTLARAIAEHDGPVVVVDQQWSLRTPFAAARRLVLEAIDARPGVVTIRFDEATDSWRRFLPRLRVALEKAGVSRVHVGGLWREMPGQGGCVTRVARYLQRTFQVWVDSSITGDMYDFGSDDERGSA